MQNYLPQKGIESEAKIQVFNWNHPGDTRIIECGIFWVDQIDCSGPPNVVSVKGTSVPVTTGIKNTKKFAAWEDVDLMTIASEISAKNGLVLVWDSAKIPPKKKRVDQSEAPDLEFLRDKVKEASLSLKIFKRQLVIYSEEEYEARPSVYTLMYGAANILAYSISSKLDDTYKGAKNSYVDPETGELMGAEFSATEPPETESELIENEIEQSDNGENGASLREGGGLFDINIGTGSGGDTEKIKSKLREKNKHEKTATFTVFGNPTYLSGLNVQLLGFGIYDGKWFIESTIHDITSSGYTTQLTLRHCLVGY